MRAVLLCALAAGLVRGAPLGQRSLDATLALIERDVAALEKMDKYLFDTGRCDDVCTVGWYNGVHPTYYRWEDKCRWVECKGCEEQCTPEYIEEDRRRRRIGYKELHEGYTLYEGGTLVYKGGYTDDELAAGFKHVHQCSSLKDDPEGCEKAYTKITKWHFTRAWEKRREPGAYLCHYHHTLSKWSGSGICSMHTEDELESKSGVRTAAQKAIQAREIAILREANLL